MSGERIFLADGAARVERLRTRRLAEDERLVCMERAEFVRYAPGSDTTDARKELLDIAASAINSIEQSFGKRGNT